MRIAFVLVGNGSRRGELSGTNIRYGGASSSGTESSTVYIAEYLSKMGNDVVVALEICSTPTIDKGVLYTNLNFDGVDNKTFDVLISSLWFSDYDSLPITVTNGLIYWYHLAWGYSLKEMCDFAKKHNLRFGVISVSNWAKKFNDEYSAYFENELDTEILYEVIPNPVCVDIIDEVEDMNINRIPHKVIFHGQWSRGGDVAKLASEQMGWDDLQFKSFDYIDVLNGVDKKTLFMEIASSDYFIFPQFTHGRLVYKDTFSLSVAEAIGLGAIVVTYPLGALPEYFGNVCQFIEYPEGVDIDKMNNERLSEEPLMGSTDNIVELLTRLENKKNELESIRHIGKEYVKNNFNIKHIGPMWDNFLNKF